MSTTKAKLMEARLQMRRAKRAASAKARKGTVRVKTPELLTEVRLAAIQAIEKG
jgi:hypothetical protein